MLAWKQAHGANGWQSNFELLIQEDVDFNLADKSGETAVTFALKLEKSVSTSKTLKLLTFLSLRVLPMVNVIANLLETSHQ